MKENKNLPENEPGCRNVCSGGACCVIVNPWVTGVLAMVELVLGFVLLGFPFVLGASAVWLCGFVLFVAGAVRLVQSVLRPVNRVWNLLAALVYIAIGVLMVQMPVFSMEIGTLCIGVALLAAGMLRLLMAAVMRGRGTMWRVFNGVVSLTLGIMVVRGWPGSSLWLIGSLIAVEMIFSGWTLLFLALAPTRS